MVRTKVKLQWIANDSSRRVSFNKRTKGIVKKVSELSTLCDVEACMVLYRPGKPHPEVIWPSVPEAARILSTLGESPEKKMIDQKGFVCHRIKKKVEQLHKHGKENRHLEMDLLLYQCLAAGRSLRGTASMDDITDLSQLVEFRIRQLQWRIGGSSEVPKLVVDEQTSGAMQQEMIKTAEEAARKVVEGEKQQAEEAMEEQQFGLTRSGQQRAFGRQIMIHPYAGDDTNQWMARAYNSQFFFWNPYYYPMN